MSKQFYIKQFSAVLMSQNSSITKNSVSHKQFKCNSGLIVKTFLFQAIQFSQTVINQTIQFSISIQLVLFNP